MLLSLFTVQSLPHLAVFPPSLPFVTSLLLSLLTSFPPSLPLSLLLPASLLPFPPLTLSPFFLLFLIFLYLYVLTYFLSGPPLSQDMTMYEATLSRFCNFLATSNIPRQQTGQDGDGLTA